MGDLINAKDVQPEVKLSVGEEFIIWAEKSWNFKGTFEKPTKENEEVAPYDYIRPVFIEKINELIKNRLGF